MAPNKWPLKSVPRYSIIKHKDTIGVWEANAKTMITEWQKTGIQLPLSTEVTVIKFPADLARDYLQGFPHS